MGHRVIGTVRHDGKSFTHGKTLSASDVGGKENFETLLAAGTVVKDDEFKRLYPEQEGEVIQPTGTPSNLGDTPTVEETEKEKQKEGQKAAPPQSKDAPAAKKAASGDPKASEKK